MKSAASKQALAIFQLNPSAGVKIGVAVSPWVSCLTTNQKEEWQPPYVLLQPPYVLLQGGGRRVRFAHTHTERRVMAPRTRIVFASCPQRNETNEHRCRYAGSFRRRSAGQRESRKVMHHRYARTGAFEPGPANPARRIPCQPR